MQSQISKVKKINNMLILLYFVSTILALFQVNITGKIILGIVISISTLFLLFINMKDLRYKNTYIVPLYYYIFVLIIIITIHFSGSYNSVLYPALFLIPFLHSVINFSRKECTAIIFFILAVMWLMLMEDIYLNKIYQVGFVSVYIAFAQIIIEFLKKEYKNYKKELLFTLKDCIEENKE